MVNAQGLGSKVVKTFTKKPFKERMKDTMYLIKNSFTIIGKDSDIITATWRMILMSVVMTTMFFFSLFTFFYKWHIGYGVLSLLVLLFILVPYRFFFDVRQKACQSWVVYNTVIGKDISFKDAKKHTKEVKGTLRKIALVAFLMEYVSSQQ